MIMGERKRERGKKGEAVNERGKNQDHFFKTEFTDSQILIPMSQNTRTIYVGLWPHLSDGLCLFLKEYPCIWDLSKNAKRKFLPSLFLQPQKLRLRLYFLINLEGSFPQLVGIFPFSGDCVKNPNIVTLYKIPAFFLCFFFMQFHQTRCLNSISFWQMTLTL